MNTLNIAIEVNFGEATLNLLQAFISGFGAKSAKTAGACEPAKTGRTVEAKPEAAPATAAQTAQPAPTASSNGRISDEELRAAVKAAKDNTSAADVKALFAQFGIRSSIECPDEKRGELMNQLNELAKR